MRVVSSDHHSLDRIDPTKVDPEYVLKTPSEPPIAEEQVLFPWLYPFSFLFLNFSCGMGIYSTSENETFLGFIISDYLIFLVCFFVLRRLEGNGATVRDKRRKVSSRYCSVAVSVYFLFQIATVLPRTLATVVWTVAGAEFAANRYSFYIHLKALGDLTGATTLAGAYQFYVYDSLAADAGSSPPSSKA
ncbi:unnamed protein product [Spirodela intermedia]|uniref:Uncharacterized protein n=1 Tax=Spirodela intermedia TaxID=51605 RepID=A0A7I8LL63_SPIIN|nr:unnamed protein product [Spirodela intermedia]